MVLDLSHRLTLKALRDLRVSLERMNNPMKAPPPVRPPATVTDLTMRRLERDFIRS